MFANASGPENFRSRGAKAERRKSTCAKNEERPGPLSPAFLSKKA
jgi:hypothetical protein